MATYKSGLIRRKLVFDGRILVERLRDLVRVVNERSFDMAEVRQFETDIDAFADSVSDWRAAVLDDLPNRVGTTE